MTNLEDRIVAALNAGEQDLLAYLLRQRRFLRECPEVAAIQPGQRDTEGQFRPVAARRREALHQRLRAEVTRQVEAA